MALNLNDGILRKQSNHSVAETLTNLRRELEGKRCDYLRVLPRIQFERYGPLGPRKVPSTSA